MRRINRGYVDVGTVIVLLFFALVVFVIFSAVNAERNRPSEQDALEPTGILNECTLVRVENHNSLEASIDGSFFLGIGSVSGSIGPEFKIQFYWEPKPGEYIVSTLPYSKFRFIIDETKPAPTVRFVFVEWWLRSKSNKSYPNLNDLVMTNVMEVAEIRISSKDMENEIYLPKVGPERQ